MIISLTSLKGQGKDTVAKIIKALDWYHNRDKDYLKTKYSDTEFALRVLNGESMEYSSFENKKFADSLKGILTILLNCKMSDFEDREFKEKTLGPEWWVWKQYTDDSPNYTLHPYIENEIPPKDSILFKPTVRYLLQFIGTDLLRNQLNPNIWVNNLLSQYTPKIELKYPNVDDNEYNKILYPNWIITDTRFLNEIQAIKKIGNPYILVKIERITDKKDFHISELELEDYRGYNYVIDNNGTIIDLIEQVKKILVTENIIKI